MFDYPNLYVCPAPSVKSEKWSSVRADAQPTCKDYWETEDVDTGFCDICKVHGLNVADLDAGRCGLFNLMR